MHDRVTPMLLRTVDDVMSEEQRRDVNNFLRDENTKPGWAFGWRSNGNKDPFSFWHRHFAGYRQAGSEINGTYDCEAEVSAIPLIHAVWRQLADGELKGHRLIRCYANGHTYGSDGFVHTDTAQTNTYTSIYYPHPEWNANWGGETVFFTPDRSDIIASIYPRSNRMLMFDGRIPHVARGVSRICPVLRVTLMFKTDKLDAT